MSLSTGASLITLSLLLNKVSGLYGLLALLTGYELNPLQLSMYIYSLLALALTAYLAPHIRTQSPLHCLALAWFYLLDSIINAAYTAAFGVTWFLVLAQHNAGLNAGEKGPGAGTIDETAGFTDPEHNVSGVHVVIPGSEAPGSAGGMVAHPASTPAGAEGGSSKLSHSVLQPESMNSLGVIIALWTIRLYFCVVMLSYARLVLRRHISLSSLKNNVYTSASTDSGIAENPFAASLPEGQGWKGKLGRLMVAFPRVYWLGVSDDGGPSSQDISWMEGMGGRFRKAGIGHHGSSAASGSASASAGAAGGVLGYAQSVDTGPLERERRRRSGTGPPPPPVQLIVPGQEGLNVPLQDLS